MTVFLPVFLILFVVPIVAGAGWGGFVWVCDRRRLARAFAHGRATVPHLPAVPRPVEAWPVFIAVAGEAA